MRPTFFMLTALLSFKIGTLHAAPPTELPLALDIDVRTGWVHGEHSLGFSVGASPRLRYRVLTLGLDLQGATIIVEAMGSVAATAGLSFPFGRVRLDALGEFGVNGYTRVESNMATKDPGASGALPYAGGRGALLFCVSCNPGGRSVWLGLTASYARDLYSVDRTYTFVDPGNNWFDEDSPEEITRSVRLGQRRLSAFFTASFAIPL